MTSAGIDWQREKWQSGLGSKFIHQGEKNAAKYADEVIVLSKGVQDYFKEKDGMMPRKMQLSFRLKKMNKVPSRLKSVQLDIASIWSYNTSKWT